MEDERIIDLYFQRNEDAISESDRKYGHYLKTVSYNVLRNTEDSEECVSDTWLHAWNSIPPIRPRILKAWFAKITRNLSLNRLQESRALKRGGGETDAALDELVECIPDSHNVEDQIDGIVLSDMITEFLSGLPKKHRVIFLQRYFYACEIKEIAALNHVGESYVKTLLFRIRNRLKEALEKEGIAV